MISGLLVIQALKLAPSPEASGFLINNDSAAFPISRMMHDGPVYAVAFSPDGKFVVSGSYDNTARVWDVATGKEVSRMTHKYVVNTVAFSQDGKYVISGSQDGTVRVWEVATGKEVSRMTHVVQLLESH